VDESGNQLAVFGRRGARPFNRAEMQRLYLHPENGAFYSVADDLVEPPRSTSTTSPSSSARFAAETSFFHRARAWLNSLY
jgi:hypothetical protein